MTAKRWLIRLLAASLLGQIAAVHSVRAQMSYGPRFAYDVTIENVKASNTRNLTRGTAYADRDFAQLVVAGVRSKPRTEKLWEPKTADGLFADRVLGDGQVHPGPVDPATGQPQFRLGPVVMGSDPDEHLMVGYSVIDLSHDTYDVSLKKLHTAVLALNALIYTGVSFIETAGGLIPLMGAISTDISDFAARLLGIDDPHTFNCDGAVLSDELWISGDQLAALTENPSHSLVLTDPKFLLPNSNSKGVTATDRGAGYMGLGDAPSKCGSRSLYEIRVVVRRIDTNVPSPVLNGGPAPCPPGSLVPAGIVQASDWVGSWADPTRRVFADIKPVLLIDFRTHRQQDGFSVATRERERTVAGLNEDFPSNNDGALPVTGSVQDHGADRICCSNLTAGPGGNTADKPLGSTVTTLLRSPGNVSLQGYKGCYDAARGEPTHLRYLRTNQFNTVVTDTILVRQQAPPR